jgi:hypothetical protein
LVATNTYGTVFGADAAFTTPGFPTALIEPPLTTVLVPTPAFDPPSTGEATTIKSASRAQAKNRKQKMHKKEKRKKGRKATTRSVERSVLVHGKAGSGR